MTVLNGFYKASYSIGGSKVNFFARVCQEPQIGRKTVIHEYPQSDSRYVQDNGKISGIYTLQVQVQETTSSAYKRAIKKLIKALETPGLGTLTHPELGKKKVVPTNSSRLSNIVSENGISNFNLTFFESDENKYPTTTQGNIGLLGRLFDSLSASNQTALTNAFDATNRGLEVYNQARDSVQEVTSIINDSVATVNGFADELAAFSADIADFQDSINEVIQTPTNLSLRLSNIWGSISTITDNFGDMFKLSLNIYGTGSGATNIVAQSPITDNINSNNTALSNNNNVSALNLAYITSVNVDYASQEEIDANLDLLDDAFYGLDPNTVDEDVYYTLQDIRVQNRLYLEGLKLGLPFLQSIKTNSIPTSILAYNLYADSTRAAEIEGLNSVEDPAFISGNINVLSE